MKFYVEKKEEKRKCLLVKQVDWNVYISFLFEWVIKSHATHMLWEKSLVIH